MQKYLTSTFTALCFTAYLTILQAQTVIWPTSDTTLIKISQFAEANSIVGVSKANPIGTTPANHKGWITFGVRGASNPDSAVWQWTADGTGRIGSFWGNIPRIASDSRYGTGAAIFNSDYLDSKNKSAAPHNGELWSPVINAANNNNLTVSFTSFYRHFESSDEIPCASSIALSWSEDGGVTWVDTLCINEAEYIATNNGSVNPNFISVKLRGSRGTDKFRIKFIFDGNYYFWLVDDVRVLNIRNNVSIDPNWFAQPPVGIPLTQADTIRFMTDIRNNGNSIARNAKVTARVINRLNNAVLYSETRNYGNLAVDSLAENELIGKGFLPTQLGNYQIQYIASSDSIEEFRSDDTLRANFSVVDSIYANNNNSNIPSRPADRFWSANEIKAWRLGNYFYFPKGSKATATRIQGILDITSDANQNFAGAKIGGVLYRWIDTNKNDTIEAAEREIIGAGEYTIPATQTTDTVNIRLENIIGSGAIKLQDNTAYLAMIEIKPANNKQEIWGYLDANTRNPHAYKFATKKAGKPRYFGVVGYNGNDEALPWFTDVFTQYYWYVPAVRMWAFSGLTSTVELSNDYKMDIAPNPAQDNLNILIDFPKTEEGILLRVVDMAGNVVLQKDFDNVKNQTLDLPIISLANGAYTLHLTTLGGKFKAKRFVVAK
jgi:hypothetical protein